MGRWTGVVTNGGAELLNEWAGGGTLRITGAASGDGTVPEAALLAQTNLSGTQRKASVVGYRKIAGGTQIRIQVTASKAEEYTLHQFGVWAKLNNEPEVLLAVFQTEKDIPIPNSEESPDFTYTFYGVVAMDNTGKIVVDVDTNAAVSMETLMDAIDRLKLEIMTNDLTLPLAVASGEPLLTSAGTPILAVYHPRELGGNYEY